MSFEINRRIDVSAFTAESLTNKLVDYNSLPDEKYRKERKFETKLHFLLFNYYAYFLFLCLSFFSSLPRYNEVKIAQAISES